MRSATDQQLGGVCAGFADYFGLDPTILRIVWAISIFIPLLDAVAILGYLIAWIVMPVAPSPVRVSPAKLEVQTAS